MFKKIVIGYDGSDQSRDAVALAKLLAEATGAELVAAAVWHPLSGLPNPAPYGRALLGSSSAHLLRDAPCPAIVFPRGARTAGSGNQQPESVGAGR